MKKERAKRVFSSLFLSIFFLKMVISIAPLIIEHFDKQAIHAVIMQLEIENDAKDKEVKEFSGKEMLTLNNFCINVSHPELLVLPYMINADHDKHVQAFYPPVPTPPPNV